MLVVVGAAGAPEYAERFARTADAWRDHAKAASAKLVLIGRDTPAKTSDRERLRAALAKATASKEPPPLWVVLVGHGTFDGRTARFNLRGPDVSATELAEWLARAPSGTVVINGASASAPFLKPLAAPGRIVITATKTGWERNATRFGEYFAQALGEVGADLDRDEAVSVLEAFLAASRKVEAYFEGQGFLTPEHALLDDTGDGIGTPASFYSGLERTRSAIENAQPDGDRARQVALLPIPADALAPREAERRDVLEQQLAGLREARSKLRPEVYYARLERILLELAGLYEQRASDGAGPGGGGGRDRGNDQRAEKQDDDDSVDGQRKAKPRKD